MKEAICTPCHNPLTDSASVPAVESRPLELPELGAISGGDVIVTFN